MSARRATASRHGSRGFTLVELMVACLISLMVLVILSRTLASGSASERTNSSASDIATNGRYALEVLRRSLMHAGYRALSWAPTGAMTTATPVVTNDCSAGFAINIAQPVWGSNDSNPFQATCVAAANYAGGDMLVTRQAAGEPSTVLDANTVYLRSSYDRAEVFQGSTPPPLFTATPREDHALQTFVFYVSPYSVSATESPRIPGLYRLSLGSGPAMTSALVASNVEALQVQYGRTTTDLKTRFYNANQINAAVTPSEWNDVSAVRIWILVRASTPETAYVNNSSYVLGDQTITVNDSYRREVFSTVVQVRNK
jgi:type IV pilus assembly protein PilW